MPTYSQFIGIDIGKFEVVVATSALKSTLTFPNTPIGLKDFLKPFKGLPGDTLVVLETTGGYEKLFLHGLCERKIAVHRANTRHVKAFIRSFGVKGKTDAIDAIQLAHYGQERHENLLLYQLDNEREDLKSLAERRSDLTQMLVQEKNRLKSPSTSPRIAQSCQQAIEFLENQIETITTELGELISKDAELTEKKEILKTVPGIGEVLSSMLVVLLPELGQLNRRQIASLAGLAPHPRESGTKQGYRRTLGGWPGVKKLLFMAGMTATRSKSRLGDFYRAMVTRGKKKMVALVALMRKIIVIANARIKENLCKNNDIAVVVACGKSA